MGNEAYKYHLITPSDEEVELAQRGERLLEAALDSEAEDLKDLLVEFLARPGLRSAVSAVLEELAKSGEIAVASTGKSLSSQQAANFLGVSRPHLNKLLDLDVIRSHKTGSHRRVYFKDVLEYKRKRDMMSTGLDALADDAQKNKLGW